MVDDVIQMCQDLGSGAPMAKVNLRNAFQLCIKHLSDPEGLAPPWNSYTGTTTSILTSAFPFGLRSAPLAIPVQPSHQGFEWILKQEQFPLL